MTQLYFAYGSNMSSRRLGERIRPIAVSGVARLEGWRLVFNKPGGDGSGKANLVEDARSESWGVVWRIARSDWPTLDAFEPGYLRESCRVIDREGGIVNAQVYLHPASGPDLAPWRWYLDHLLCGAREHGLPAGIVEQLLQMRARE